MTGTLTSVTADELVAELRALLVPYEDVLEAAEIYGIEVLHRPGARAHDWFAGVRPGKGTAKLMLLPIKAHPELVEDISPALRKRCRATPCSHSKPATRPCSPELEALVQRSFDAYVGQPPGEG